MFIKKFKFKNNDKANFMSLQKKGTIILVIIFAISALSCYVLLKNIMFKSTDKIEKIVVNGNLTRTHIMLKSQITYLQRLAIDWAVWDDTYEFVQSKPNKYLASNMSDSVFHNLNLNLMLITDTNGKVFYGKVMDSGNKTASDIDPKDLKTISDLGIIYNKNHEYSMYGILSLNRGLMLISSYPILHSDYSGLVKGNFLFGRYLDHALIGKLSKELNLKLSNKSDSIPKKKLNELTLYNIKKPHYIIASINDHTIKAEIEFPDLSKKQLVSLSVEIPRDVNEVGKNSMNSMLILFCIAFTIMLFLLIYLLNRFILSKVVILHNDVMNISNHKLLSERVSDFTANDELGVLSNEINNMLSVTENLNQKLQSAKDNLEIQVYERTRQLVDTNDMLQNEIIERKRIQDEITYLAYHDNLTELPNRLMFADRLTQSISLAQRTGKILGVMFLDLDGFKGINDTLGHQQGDMLLKEVSSRLTKVLRLDDTICRIGGDEFIISTCNLNNIDDIISISNKIIHCFSYPFPLKRQEYHVTCSMGVAQYPIDGSDVESLIKNADLAMYEAKACGKNQFVLCTKLMKENVIETMALTNSLYKALELNQLELYYQPQVSGVSAQINGVEALLRWHHPEFGMVSPIKFIPLAEKTCLILYIGEWVLREACRQNREWLDRGYPEMRMAVNLSVHQLKSPDIVDLVQSIIKETGINPSSLELEITESVTMDKSVVIETTLTQLKTLGISLSIDDFGTEYSSLSRLKDLPVDRVKIDKSFVHGIEVNRKDEAIITAIILLAKSLGLDTIAEGVETSTQLDFLNQKMCDEIQGYYMYMPMEAREFEKILAVQKMPPALM